MVVAAKLAGKYARPVKRERVPACTYCEPQIGSVGLTEAAAKEKGLQVKVGKFPFTANSKASIVDSHEGFVKIVADAKYGEILGVHIIGPQATELIAEAVTAMELEATVEEMMFTIHAHPTLAEAMLDGFGSVRKYGHQRVAVALSKTKVRQPRRALRASSIESLCPHTMTFSVTMPFRKTWNPSEYSAHGRRLSPISARISWSGSI